MHEFFYCLVVGEKTPVISAPSMWTRKELKEFKESLKSEKDSIIKVGSGETVTVCVVIEPLLTMKKRES